jgi:hypothetical protein
MDPPTQPVPLRPSMATRPVLKGLLLRRAWAVSLEPEGASAAAVMGAGGTHALTMMPTAPISVWCEKLSTLHAYMLGLAALGASKFFWPHRGGCSPPGSTSAGRGTPRVLPNQRRICSHHRLLLFSMLVTFGRYRSHMRHAKRSASVGVCPDIKHEHCRSNYLAGLKYIYSS